MTDTSTDPITELRALLDQPLPRLTVDQLVVTSEAPPPPPVEPEVEITAAAPEPGTVVELDPIEQVFEEEPAEQVAVEVLPVPFEDPEATDQEALDAEPVDGPVDDAEPKRRGRRRGRRQNQPEAAAEVDGDEEAIDTTHGPGKLSTRRSLVIAFVFLLNVVVIGLVIAGLAFGVGPIAGLLATSVGFGATLDTLWLF